jgi:hypothetical protein
MSKKVHAVPTRSTAVKAAQIMLDMTLRIGDSVPDVLMVDHDPLLASKLFKEFTRSICSNLKIVEFAYHKKTNTKPARDG